MSEVPYYSNGKDERAMIVAYLRYLAHSQQFPLDGQVVLIMAAKQVEQGKAHEAERAGLLDGE